MHNIVWKLTLDYLHTSLYYVLCFISCFFSISVSCCFEINLLYYYITVHDLRISIDWVSTFGCHPLTQPGFCPLWFLLVFPTRGCFWEVEKLVCLRFRSPWNIHLSTIGNNLSPGRLSLVQTSVRLVHTI